MEVGTGQRADGGRLTIASHPGNVPVAFALSLFRPAGLESGNGRGFADARQGRFGDVPLDSAGFLGAPACHTQGSKSCLIDWVWRESLAQRVSTARAPITCST